MSAQDEIDAIYEKKRASGLVDVKFLHKNLDESTPDLIESDFLNILKAIDDGKSKPFDFGDLHLKKA